MKCKLAVCLTLTLLATGCYHPTNMNTVISDLKTTPRCDTSSILVHPTDTKKTLTGKIVVLNSKLDCHDDSKFYIEKKLSAYESL